MLSVFNTAVRKSDQLLWFDHECATTDVMSHRLTPHVITIMSASCHDHQIFQVQWLLRHGAVIKSDKFGKTPMSDAAENKQLEVKLGNNQPDSYLILNTCRFCLCWCNTITGKTGNIGGRVALKNRTSQMTLVLVIVPDDNRSVFILINRRER